jgi:nucleoid DNA-binding protein
MNLQEMMVSHFFSEENKKKIIEKINDNVNIPIINEKTEEKIFTTIFEVIEDVLVNKK